MKNIFKLIVVLLFAVLCVQCTKEEISPEAKEIGLEIQDDDNFSGKLSIDNSTIHYSAIALSELQFNVQISIDKRIIEASIDYQEEGIVMDGHDNSLTESQKEALLQTGSVIADYLLAAKNGDISMGEYSLLTLIEYWGKSPSNYIYSKRNITNLENTNGIKSRNEGVTCIRRNTNVNAEYDDVNGNHVDRVKVGSRARSNFGCMGRCGADCGRWWIPSAWTKDCLDHDQCSNVNNANGGSSDRNCGDEFDEAADDYVFGVIRGCRG